MRAFRIGYILTLGFLLVLTVLTMTFGYFPAPSGPKAPKYPSYSSYTDYGSSSYGRDEYNEKYKQYQKELEKYEQEQKAFIQDKIVPYVQAVFVAWIILFAAFQVIGLLLAKFGSALVGAAYSFSGLWAVLFGPLSGFVLFVGSIVSGIVSSFASQAEAEFTVRPIFQTVGLTSLISVIVLTILGVLLYGRVKIITDRILPEESAVVTDPPVAVLNNLTPSSPPTVPQPENPPPTSPPAAPPNLSP